MGKRVKSAAELEKILEYFPSMSYWFIGVTKNGLAPASKVYCNDLEIWFKG